MLRLFFQGIEQTLGPSLSTVAFLIYWGGMILLAVSLLAPLLRRWMEYTARHLGIEQHWIMPCPNCNRQTVVTASSCGFCDTDLEIPGSMKFWTGATKRRPSLRVRELRWGIQLFGNILFVLFAAWLVTALGALSPEGSLDKLFFGFGLFGLAGLGWFGGRAVRVTPSGILARARDGLGALAAIGILTLSWLLAGQASPVPETVLARFSAEHGAARIGNDHLPLPGGEIGFEYLQLDHEVLGYHEVISLAFLGQQRLPTSHCPLLRPLIGHLRANPDAYAARGLTVRLRADRRAVTPGRSYEVVRSRGQVLIRPALEAETPGSTL